MRHRWLPALLASAGLLVTLSASPAGAAGKTGQLTFNTEVTIPCSGTAYEHVTYVFNHPVDLAYAGAWPLGRTAGDISPIVSQGHPATRFSFRIKLTRPHWPAGFYTARVYGFKGLANERSAEQDSQGFGFIVDWASCIRVL